MNIAPLFLGIGMPGTTEMLIILFVILLLFGAKKLPELSRSLGRSLGEFKKGQKDGEETDNRKLPADFSGDDASDEETKPGA